MSSASVHNAGPVRRVGPVHGPVCRSAALPRRRQRDQAMNLPAKCRSQFHGSHGTQQLTTPSPSRRRKEADGVDSGASHAPRSRVAVHPTQSEASSHRHHRRPERTQTEAGAARRSHTPLKPWSICRRPESHRQVTSSGSAVLGIQSRRTQVSLRVPVPGGGGGPRAGPQLTLTLSGTDGRQCAPPPPLVDLTTRADATPHRWRRPPSAPDDQRA